jgi:hypothetical protein
MATGNGASGAGQPTNGMTLPVEETTVQNLPGILREPLVATAPARKMNTDIPNILPHERVFPIQIGSELFRLSGASISSDGMYLPA